MREADAVIYGFAPSVPARLGLDFASLSAINPRIVVAQIIGLHDEGEWANAPAFDLMLQAMSGVMSITGEEGGKPVRVGYQVADLAGGFTSPSPPLRHWSRRSPPGAANTCRSRCMTRRLRC